VSFSSERTHFLSITKTRLGSNLYLFYKPYKAHKSARGQSAEPLILIQLLRVFPTVF